MCDQINIFHKKKMAGVDPFKRACGTGLKSSDLADYIEPSIKLL